MKISYDEAKRLRTLRERGLDFENAHRVFSGDYLEFLDDRHDYGENRYIVFGELDGRADAIVWPPPRRHAPHHFDETCT